MKLTASHEISKGRYGISIDSNPGALELRDIDGNIQARIYAVSPKLKGSTGGFLHGSSANAYIMEKDCIIYGKALQIDVRRNLVHSQLINLIWNFCIENELDVSPIEFDISTFVKLWFEG